MKYKLILCEGNNEKTLIELLLERNLLIFKKEELLWEEVFARRQLNDEINGKIRLTSIEDKIEIFRIGDKLSDVLRIPKEFTLLKKIESVIKVSTLPEFEILFIIKEKSMIIINVIAAT